MVRESGREKSERAGKEVIAVADRCPDDIELERYIYGDLPLFGRMHLKRHLRNCPQCRERVMRLREFNRLLSSIQDELKLEEPPPEFSTALLDAVKTWEQTPNQVTGSVGNSPNREEPLPSFPLRVRLAISGGLMILGGFLRLRLGDYFPVIGQDAYFLGWKEIKTLWEFFSSGAIWDNLHRFWLAFRADGLSSLEILGSTIPIVFMSVIVCGGIVTAVFIRGLRSSQSGGDK